jgi:hypothetical protein
MEEIIEQLIERGSIKVSDEFSFRTKAECASLFGRNYSNIVKGGIPHPKEEKSQMIFWQEGENDEWENKYVEDKNNEIVEFTERKKSKNQEWIKKRLEICKSRIKDNIIFYKINGGGYKFRGIFHIDEEETISSGIIVYKRISSEASTYKPINEKPIKDLKGLIEIGRIKENEEIYFNYKGTEYTGRVTKDGQVNIFLGTFSISRSALKIMAEDPEYIRKKETANGYNCWKNWNGIPIGELRKR